MKDEIKFTLQEAAIAERMKEQEMTEDQIAKVLSKPIKSVKDHFLKEWTESQRDELVDYWRDHLSPEHISVRMKLPLKKVKQEMKHLLLID